MTDDEQERLAEEGEDREEGMSLEEAHRHLAGMPQEPVSEPEEN